MQAVPTNIDEESRRRKPPTVAPGANALVEHAEREKHDKNSEDRHCWFLLATMPDVRYNHAELK